MHTPIKDFPDQIPEGGSSALGKVQDATRKWAREVTFAIRALQNAGQTTTASPTTPPAVATRPPVTVIPPTSVRWGRILGTLGDQADLANALAGREPKFDIPPERSVPFFDTDGTRGWFSLAALKAALAALSFIRTTSADTTLSASDETVIVSAGATVTLPKASNYKNKQFNIIRSGTSNVTVAVTGADTISGQSSLTLVVQWASVVVISDGLNWVICS